MLTRSVAATRTLWRAASLEVAAGARCSRAATLNPRAAAAETWCIHAPQQVRALYCAGAGDTGRRRHRPAPPDREATHRLHIDCCVRVWQVSIGSSWSCALGASAVLRPAAQDFAASAVVLAGRPYVCVEGSAAAAAAWRPAWAAQLASPGRPSAQQQWSAQQSEQPAVLPQLLHQQLLHEQQQQQQGQQEQQEQQDCHHPPQHCGWQPPSEGLALSSVKKKRHLKMKKHQRRKRRKRDRFKNKK